MKKISFIIFLSINIFQITKQQSCESYKSCISCSLNRNCKWDNNLCINSNSNSIIKIWYEQIDICLKDKTTNENKNNYCIEDDLTIKSLEHNGNYLPENKELYCYFEIKKEGFENKKIKVDFDSYNIFSDNLLYNEGKNGNIKRYVSITYKFEDRENVINVKNKYNTIIKNTYSIYLRFLIFDNSTKTSNKNYNKSLFTLNLKYDNSIDSYNKIMIVVVLIFCLLTLSLIILIILITFPKNQENNNNNSNNNIHQIVNEEEYNKLIKNKKSLEKILRAIKYKDIKHDSLYNNVCTICFDTFIEEDEILVLPCNHVFHSDCIKKWLEAILEDPICPNCKLSIINYSNNNQILPNNHNENENNNNNDNNNNNNNDNLNTNENENNNNNNNDNNNNNNNDNLNTNDNENNNNNDNNNNNNSFPVISNKNPELTELNKK